MLETSVTLALTVRDLCVADLAGLIWTGEFHARQIGAESNPRARSLYERLGYIAYGRRPDSWDQHAPDGTVYRYETTCTLMRKNLR